MRILFHLPTRSRFAKAKAAVQNIIDHCQSDNYKIIVSADLDDHTMHPFTFVHPKVILIWGQSNNKIHACNRSISFVKEWDILVATSDDMQFMEKGFDNKIREAVTNNPDHLIHFDDSNQRSNVCTLSIMDKAYYERFNYVYHPSYESLWADCEATDVAKLLGRYKYMGDGNIIFRHNHPAWGRCDYDEQYRRQDSHSQSEKDKQVYLSRKQRNFDLTI